MTLTHTQAFLIYYLKHGSNLLMSLANRSMTRCAQVEDYEGRVRS